METLTARVGPDILLLILLSIVGLAALIVVKSFLNQRAFQERMKKIDQSRPLQIAKPAGKQSLWNQIFKSSHKGLEIKLRELQEQQDQRLSGRKNPSLLIRIRQAGLDWSVTSYFLLNAVVAAGFILFFIVRDFGLIISLGLGISLGLLLPHFLLKFLTKRRLSRFETEFPNSVDIMVRGLRSGLPLIDCLRIAAKDTQEPIRSEFQKVIDDQAVGIPTHESIIKMAERIPLTEVNFLAIVVKIQNKTGGSLAEALHNLSNTLRERRKMQGKIRAMSQEAKSSAAIIGSLPFFVAGILYFMNPDYLLLLVRERIGIIVLVCAALWMLLGISVMRKMIDFKV